MAKIMILEIPDNELSEFETNLPTNSIKESESLSLSKVTITLRSYLADIEQINTATREKRIEINRLKAESQKLAEETREIWANLERAA